MNSIKHTAKDKAAQLDVKGAKAIFENGIRRQRAPSPAPVKMASRTPLIKKPVSNASAANISAFKEKFEQFSAPKFQTSGSKSSTIRRAASESNVSNGESDSLNRPKGRIRSNSAAEKNWFKVRTKVYEQLGGDQRAQSLGPKSATASPILERKKLGTEKLTGKRDEKVETLSERINKYKSGVEEKKAPSEKAQPVLDEKAAAKIKDIKSTFSTQKSSAETTEKPKAHSIADKFPLFSQPPAPIKKNDEHNEVQKTSHSHHDKRNTPNSVPNSTENHKTETKLPPVTRKIDSNERIGTTTNTKTDAKVPREKPIHKSIDNNNHATTKKEKKITDIHDHDTARNFMDELIAAIDNDQHVPMKQLITMFETMKKENSDMKDSIENLKSQLDKSDIESINQSLRTKLEDTAEQLKQAQEQINMVMVFKEALRESEERCEELEELNHHYLEEMEELKLVMNEMRDQFHDDEVHETIILQQRLDDMARSLRIIHFRLKKADAKLQETEREKETLLEEIKLLQGGTFTDEEIRRMQSLEGDLQAAKEVSVELHNQLERSEERRERLESESAQLRGEVKSMDMENERLKNNIIHLREQMNGGSGVATLKPMMALVRQGSSADLDTLKNNLEASIERENDNKEQLLQAEEEAKMFRKRLRDIEHENEALTKQLKKLSQAAHNKGAATADANLTSEHIQTEVIQLENVELRRNNDKLHHDIDSLKSKIKSLQQKLTLLHDEQHEGPLSMNKNSIYYETKFELMTQEIDDLRKQLQDRDNDYKRLREETKGKSPRRDQFRRAISIDSESLDTKKQLDIVQQEADILKDKLQQLEKDNDRLLKENQRLQSPSTSRGHSQETANNNDKMLSRLESLERENSRLLEQLRKQSTEEGEKEQQQTYNEIESENSRLITELNYFRKSKPDIAKLVNNLTESEQKILSYETEIALLRSDMFKMERNLQDDINGLTMKNNLLRSLLEAINDHEESEDSGISQTSDSSRQNKHTFTSSSTTVTKKMEDDNKEHQLATHNEISNDSVIAKHINRLPQEIQSQFKQKIDCLERQLQEERERAKAAEGLLQQVKHHLRGCVLLSPIAQMMQPRKQSRYPNPPPSLVIKPSANNSPSHVLSRARRLPPSQSAPERMKVGLSLANQLYLGGHAPTSTCLTECADESQDDMLTVNIPQPTERTSNLLQDNSWYGINQKTCNSQTEPASPDMPVTNGPVTIGPVTNGHVERSKVIKSFSMDETKYTRTVSNSSDLSPEIIITSSPSILKTNLTKTSSNHLDVKPKQKSANDSDSQSNTKSKKNNLRQKFFDNYSSVLALTYRAKKKVSFALPSLERDVSDISISSHLSAISDCVVLDDEEDDI